MRERTDLTIHRTTDVPVFVVDNSGDYPDNRVDQSSATFTVSPKEANKQIDRLQCADELLTFQKGDVETIIPVRHIVQVDRVTYIPKPKAVELLEAPDGALYLGRVDEDESIVYPADFERDRDTDYLAEDGALGVMGYLWTEDGDDPTTVSGVQPMPRPTGLKRVATYSHGTVYPALAERENEGDAVEIIAGPAACQYIGEKAISQRLAGPQL